MHPGTATLKLVGISNNSIPPAVRNLFDLLPESGSSSGVLMSCLKRLPKEAAFGAHAAGT
jgi:hypothetical protein